MEITVVGNIEVPAYLVLIEKGYEVSHVSGADYEIWLARRDNDSFRADSPLTLLGLVTMAESRGESRHASDEEIDAFLERYPPTPLLD